MFYKQMFGELFLELFCLLPQTLENKVVSVSIDLRLLSFVTIQTRIERSYGISELLHDLLTQDIKALRRILRTVHRLVKTSNAVWAIDVLRWRSNNDLSQRG